MTLLRLTSGVIRGREAVVSGACEGPGFDALDIVAMGAGGRELSRQRLADCLASGGMQGFEARLRFDGLLKGVYFASPDPAFRIETDPAYELTNLFFESEEEYLGSSYGARRRAGRPRDKETDCFLSRQLAEAYDGALEDRMLMTVSYAYRSVEIGAADEIAHAIHLLAERMGDTGMLGLSHQFRRDRTHQRVSILTARWHGELALGRVSEFRATLGELLEIAPHVMISQQVFRTCNNTIRGLAVLVAFAVLRGERKLAFEALSSVREVLRFAGMRMEDEPAVLQEFSGVCRHCAAMTPVRKALGRDLDAPFERAALEAGLVRPAIRSSNLPEMLEAFGRAVEARDEISRAAP
jgi:hypothetical protein